MFVKITNGQPIKYPYMIGELRRENANTSFPKVIPEETLSQYGVYRVQTATAPKFDNKTHSLVDTVENVGGVWKQKWIQKKIPEDRASSNLRHYRDRLLAETDWVVIKAQETGVAIDAAWSTYRQALRDITTHANWPHLSEADWPTKP